MNEAPPDGAVNQGDELLAEWDEPEPSEAEVRMERIARGVSYLEGQVGAVSEKVAAHTASAGARHHAVHEELLLIRHQTLVLSRSARQIKYLLYFIAMCAVALVFR